MYWTYILKTLVYQSQFQDDVRWVARIRVLLIKDTFIHITVEISRNLTDGDNPAELAGMIMWGSSANDVLVWLKLKVYSGRILR